MKKISYHILRIGLGITFLWIGILIFRNPVAWGALIQPWAAKLVPGTIVDAMRETAVLDILVGAFLLCDIFTWLAALVGAVHIVIVLVVCGVTDITVRDIGLLGAITMLTIETLPQKLSAIFFRR